MIKTVHLRSFSPNDIPHKFEAGTPAIAEAVGFGAAVEYLNGIGMDAVAAHEQEIIAYALERLEEIPGVKVLGPAAEKKGGVASFTLEGVHPHDVAQILDTMVWQYGLVIIAPNPCMRNLGFTATTRASFYIYSLKEEVDKLVTGIYQVKKIFN